MKHYLTEKDIDACAVTETWINKDTTQETLKAKISDGYAILSQPRQDGHRGGGLALIYKKESAALIDVTSFEIAGAECSRSVLSFFEDLGNVIEKTVTSSSKLVILGDFNVNADVQNSSDAMILGEFLEIFNLQNLVSFFNSRQRSHP